jgi:transcriptional regulator with XRE-family HTH domain
LSISFLGFFSKNIRRYSVNSVEKVKKICKERKIPISKLEKDLGYSNGYIGQLRKGVFPSDRLIQIADYLGVPTDYLIEKNNDKLNARDYRDIAKNLDKIMKDIRSDEDSPLYFNGEEVDDETLILMEAALKSTLEQLKVINKVKYNPHKNKDKK